MSIDENKDDSSNEKSSETDAPFSEKLTEESSQRSKSSDSSSVGSYFTGKVGDTVEVNTEFSVTSNSGKSTLRLTRGQVLEVIEITDKGLMLRDTTSKCVSGRPFPKLYRVEGNDLYNLVGEFSSLWTNTPTFKGRVQASVEHNE